MSAAPPSWTVYVVSAILSLLLPASLPGYELDTHRDLSRAAFRLSGIRETLHTVYGIKPSDDFHGRLLALHLGRNTPEAWVALGGKHEDLPANRVLNHFYDPVHDTGLTLPVLGGERAPDWALEAAGDLPGQHHSYRDARDAFYRGLTLPSRTARERELGHTFYALGHVIHLIQDMAVPAHTRDDAHFSIGPSASLMEKYVNENVSAFGFDQDALQRAGVTMPTVARARDLWVNGTGGPGSGLAQFSNASFVSPDTNFTELREGATAERFPSPVLRLDDFHSDAPACKDGTAVPGGDRVPPIFYANRFPDPVTGAGLENRRMTTVSIFDQHLRARGLQLIFALNCFNIDAAADILLPRAVAYSASLLHYFFRGRLEVRLEVTGLTPTGLRIVNRTPGETMVGDVELYVDRDGGSRTRLASWPQLTLAPDDPAGSGVLGIPPAPGAAGLGRYLVVFRGRLGEEADAVVGAWTAPVFVVSVDRLISNGTVVYDASSASPVQLPLAWPVVLFDVESRQLNPYGPQLPGSGERATLLALYRDPLALPGDTAVVTVLAAVCTLRIITGVTTVPFVSLVIEHSTSAAEGQLVELEPPPSLEDFARYSWPGPRIARVLSGGVTGDGATFRVGNVGDVRFFGIRSTTPFPPAAGIGYQNSCGVVVTLEFQ
jgi:hypothetical protein